jgi:hypothetical protein
MGRLTHADMEYPSPVLSRRPEGRQNRLSVWRTPFLYQKLGGTYRTPRLVSTLPCHFFTFFYETEHREILIRSQRPEAGGRPLT